MPAHMFRAGQASSARNGEARINLHLQLFYQSFRALQCRAIPCQPSKWSKCKRGITVFQVIHWVPQSQNVSFNFSVQIHSKTKWRLLFLCTKAELLIVSGLLSRMASSCVYKVLYFLRVLSGKSQMSLHCCYSVDSSVFPQLCSCLIGILGRFALMSSCFCLTFKCLRNRVVSFFDSSLAKAGTLRNRQGVFFSKIVQNAHCSSRANLHYVNTSTQPPLCMCENTFFKIVI